MRLKELTEMIGTSARKGRRNCLLFGFSNDPQLHTGDEGTGTWPKSGQIEFVFKLNKLMNIEMSRLLVRFAASTGELSSGDAAMATSELFLEI